MVTVHLALKTPTRYLAQGERVVMEVHRHPIVLVRPLLAAFGAVVGALVVGALLGPGDGSQPVDTLLALVAAFFVLRLAWKWLQWLADRLVVTDQRIFEASGVLTRKVASMPLAKLTDMTYRRTLWGRLFGYGALMLETAGQNQALSKIDYLPDPDSFYRTVTSLVTARIAPHARHDTPAPPPDDEDTGPIQRVIV